MIEIDALGIGELTTLIDEYSQADRFDLEQWPYSESAKIRGQWFGNRVYLRGLIEVSSYCERDCFYCGIRKSNEKALRYRLGKHEILACCESGYELGFRTFVLQGGEDLWFEDGALCGIIEEIRSKYPDCAITLSLGERSRESYRALKAAGADRYLLRHETADSGHFSRLHPKSQSFESRKQCLYELKEAGFQVGAGFMVGSPAQTAAMLAMDVKFLMELDPHMVGIGPFIPHQDTPFRVKPAGGLQQTLLMLSLVRIALPKALLPATTALGSIWPAGRELGLKVGANVVMPNLTPPVRRDAYSLYDGKLSSGAESAEGLKLLSERLGEAGLAIDMSRGDHPDL